eukprot:250059-Amphidinium_carterae.1
MPHTFEPYLFGKGLSLQQLGFLNVFCKSMLAGSLPLWSRSDGSLHACVRHHAVLGVPSRMITAPTEPFRYKPLN